jgi:hypothetical protein
MGKPTVKVARAPAPYTKYGKVPYRYSEAYHKWRASVGKRIQRDAAQG